TPATPTGAPPPSGRAAARNGRTKGPDLTMISHGAIAARRPRRGDEPGVDAHRQRARGPDDGDTRTDGSQPQEREEEHRPGPDRTDPVQWAEAWPAGRAGRPARRGPRRLRGRSPGLVRRLEAEVPHPR